MPPERSAPRRSTDGIHKRPHMPKHRKPEYRPDHELPAPAHQDLIREHEPEVPPQAEHHEQPRQLPAEPGPEPIFRTAGPAEPRLAAAHQAVTQAAASTDEKVEVEVPPEDMTQGVTDHESAPKKKRSLWPAILGIIVVLLVLAFGAVYAWYKAELEPASSDTTKHIRETIKTGETPAAIAKQLAADHVIKSELAFTIYTKLSRTENNLKAGTYSLQPSLSTSGIVDHLVSGKEDTFDVTFLPGDTLANNRQKLIKDGYSATAVDAALAKTYDSPLFATKPAGSDLEGYFYGETNEFDVSASVSDVLTRFFGEYNDFLVKNNIAAGFQKQGLSLYQGITLASIVQSESGSNPADEPQVARVFLNRLAAGMTLGSDVTAYYGAAKIGAAHSVSVDTPYNTRIHQGLPPGPISTPGNTALLAVANPASSNYLFFLSGDDGKMYYATTDAQHQQNIQQHCQKKCAVE